MTQPEWRRRQDALLRIPVDEHVDVDEATQAEQAYASWKKSIWHEKPKATRGK